MLFTDAERLPASMITDVFTEMLALKRLVFKRGSNYTKVKVIPQYIIRGMAGIMKENCTFRDCVSSSLNIDKCFQP